MGGVDDAEQRGTQGPKHIVPMAGRPSSLRCPLRLPRHLFSHCSLFPPGPVWWMSDLQSWLGKVGGRGACLKDISVIGWVTATCAPTATVGKGWRGERRDTRCLGGWYRLL